MNKRLVSVAVFATLVGCATPYQPMVDTRGANMNRYPADLNECQQYAAQVDPGASVAASAAGGAVIGALLGAFLGNSRDVAGLAAAGALLGGAGGQGASNEAQNNIIRNCMTERGYRVLN